MKKHVNAILLPAAPRPAADRVCRHHRQRPRRLRRVRVRAERRQGSPRQLHSYTFLSPYTGYTITLTTATLQIGAVYLDAAPCSGSSAIPPCVDQNAATVAQVNGGVERRLRGRRSSGVLVDALSPDPQPFAGPGSGIIQQAQSAEVWLSSGAEVMAIDD